MLKIKEFNKNQKKEKLCMSKNWQNEELQNLSNEKDNKKRMKRKNKNMKNMCSRLNTRLKENI